MEKYLDNVAVIGAGLGGCALALALSQKNVPVTLYESRTEESVSIASGVLLSPNGLHVLDQLGVLSRIQDRCYIPTHRVFKNDNDETTEKSPLNTKGQFGYTNHRIWRSILLHEMRTMLKERNVEIHFSSKFNGILSDTADDGVTFKINESICQASLLIGSDGVYSSVRKYLAPDVQPWYTGMMGIAGHARFDAIAWPYPDYERNCTIQSKAGAMVYIAEDPLCEEAMFAIQVKYPEQSRKDLENLQADPERILSFFTEKYDQWGQTCRKIIDALRERKGDLFIWPFLRMPALERWYSGSGRIVLIGDGAHAVPPSSAQGVNQALEDAWSLGLLLDLMRKAGAVNGVWHTDTGHGNERLLETLARWQEWRQDKVDAIYDWTVNTTHVGRLPEDERQKLIAEGKVKAGGSGDATGSGDMTWLFKPDIEGNARRWVEESCKS